MPGHTLVCPFLDESNEYASGVEFGILYANMQDPWNDMIEDFFTRANQDQILLAANRLGWHVAEIKEENKDWFWCRLERK
jgi:hypothetical protein